MSKEQSKNTVRIFENDWNCQKKIIKKQQLTLPIPLIFQEYLAGKVRTIMMLRYSKDEKIPRARG